MLVVCAVPPVVITPKNACLSIMGCDKRQAPLSLSLSKVYGGEPSPLWSWLPLLYFSYMVQMLAIVF